MAPGAQEQARRGSPWYPQGHGFIAAISVKSAEKLRVPAARASATMWSSSGWACLGVPVPSSLLSGPISGSLHNDRTVHPGVILADVGVGAGGVEGEGEALARVEVAAVEGAVAGGGGMGNGVVIRPGHRRAGWDGERRWGEGVVLDRDGNGCARVCVARRRRRVRGCRWRASRQRHGLRRWGNHRRGGGWQQVSLWRGVVTRAVAVTHQVRRDGVRSGDRRFDLEDPAVAVAPAVGRPGDVEIPVRALLEVDRVVETGDDFLQGGWPGLPDDPSGVRLHPLL